METGRQRPWPLLVALVVFGLCGAVGKFRTTSTAATMTFLARHEPPQREPVPRLSVQSDYEDRLGVAIGDRLYPHTHLVEVHRVTTLSMDTDTAFEWSIAGTDGSHQGTRSHAVATRFTSIGDHAVSVVSPSGARHDFTVMARYVRREIRDLSEEDRKEYFDALSVVYRTSQDEGVVLYGENFRSAAWLVREHLYGAAQRSCDHWHDDAGFLNHHVGITMQVEQSLQAVNARVCSHYWDYTFEAELGTNYTNSIVFGEDWFGSANPQTEDHVVDHGRWAYTPVMQRARDFSNITNPYGLLRSPWNTNPVPYLMRSMYTVGVRDALYSMPACWDFASSILMANLTFAQVSGMLNGGLHGQVHIMLGGHWDFNASFAQRLNSHIPMMMSNPHISDQILLGSKFLWRQGIVRCPVDCAGDAECVCSCPDEIVRGRTAYEIFNITGMFDITPEIKTLLVEEMGYTYDELFDAFCHVGHPGEMFTSAAPQDPIFWPLHGLSERFVQLIRVLAARGMMPFDETWGYDHVTDVYSDTHLVCDWSDVREGSFDMPNCVRGQACPGHRADDILPFTDLDWARGRQFTNVDFLEAISPMNTLLPYVYDRLATWPACANQTIIPTSWRAQLRDSP